MQNFIVHNSLANYLLSCKCFVFVKSLQNEQYSDNATKVRIVMGMRMLMVMVWVHGLVLFLPLLRVLARPFNLATRKLKLENSRMNECSLTDFVPVLPINS